jgi:hypothetical protein
MPALLPAIVAQTAVAAPAVAATVAPAIASTAATTAASTAAAEAAKLAALEGGKAATLEAGKTAALEASKKGIIDASMQQAANQGITQASAQQIGQQGTANLGQEMVQKAGADAASQGIAQVGPINPATTMAPAGNVPVATTANPATPLTPAGSPPTAPVDPATAGQFNGLKATPDQAFGPNSSGIYKGVDPVTNMPYQTASSPTFNPPTGDGMGFKVPSNITESFGKPAEKNALQKGFETGLKYVKDNPTTTGLGLMSAGQYMNKPEEEDKDKYKNTVDMSGFQPTVPSQPSFTRSYEYQGYAVGGPVEQMAARNAVGANTGYPQAGLQTPMYSNPAMQRPEATNVVAPSADSGVGAFNGEARFASGGLSESQRKEYGISTRSQRATKSLTKSYDEMEEARQKEAMKLFNERSDPGIIRRSRTQELSSPFSAAQAEHGRLAKKNKVPVVPMPKTNLGDIDTYMDTPIEAAGGGIMHGLGGYSDGGRLLRGPGDGVSDSIPAVIGKRQPARLADGEFVIPARIVSELGNGSTEAGARKLYAMMERVQANRKKSIGKKKVAVNSKSDKHLPA